MTGQAATDAPREKAVGDRERAVVSEGREAAVEDGASASQHPELKEDGDEAQLLPALAAGALQQEAGIERVVLRAARFGEVHESADHLTLEEACGVGHQPILQRIGPCASDFGAVGAIGGMLGGAEAGAPCGLPRQQLTRRKRLDDGQGPIPFRLAVR